MANNPNTSTLLFFGFLCLCLSCTNSSSSSSSQRAQESDRIEHLPGQPNTPLVTQYSGYITVNESHGRALFYWFFEAQSHPSLKPLILWLNGGPGCSSVGYGAATEVGPLRVKEGGAALHFNNYSWNREANLLFLESPAGVGFSYTNTSSDFTAIDDNFVAQDSYNFLANWFQKFPEFKNHDFFIAGESYAGHYVPQLAEVIFDRNKDEKKYSHIKLKGFIVGNPSMDNYNDNKGYLDYAWSHAVISDELYHVAKKACNFARSTWSNECIEVMTNISNAYNEIEDLNLYAPKCLLNYPSSSSSATRINHIQLDSRLTNKRNIAHPKKEKSKQIPESFATCYSTYVDEYFNNIEVQKAFNVMREVKWNACNYELLNAYNLTIISVLPVYEKLIKAGLKIWIYSGDLDGNVAVIGTRYCIDALKLSLKSHWRVWFHNHQVGGRIVEYNGLTFVTVRGAGHLVPLDKPSEALAIIHSFLYGEELPWKR